MITPYGAAPGERARMQLLLRRPGGGCHRAAARGRLTGSRPTCRGSFGEVVALDGSDLDVTRGSSTAWPDRTARAGRHCPASCWAWPSPTAPHRDPGYAGGAGTRRYRLRQHRADEPLHRVPDPQLDQAVPRRQVGLRAERRTRRLPPVAGVRRLTRSGPQEAPCRYHRRSGARPGQIAGDRCRLRTPRGTTASRR